MVTKVNGHDHFAFIPIGGFSALDPLAKINSAGHPPYTRQ